MRMDSAEIYKTTTEVHRRKQLELELNLRPFKKAQDTTYTFTPNIPRVTKYYVYKDAQGILNSMEQVK